MDEHQGGTGDRKQGTGRIILTALGVIVVLPVAIPMSVWYPVLELHQLHEQVTEPVPVRDVREFRVLWSLILVACVMLGGLAVVAVVRASRGARTAAVVVTGVAVPGILLSCLISLLIIDFIVQMPCFNRGCALPDGPVAIVAGWLWP